MKTLLNWSQPSVLERKNKQTGREKENLLCSMHRWRWKRIPALEDCGHSTQSTHLLVLSFSSHLHNNNAVLSKATPPIMWSSMAVPPQDLINAISTFSVIISSQVSFKTLTCFQVLLSHLVRTHPYTGKQRGAAKMWRKSWRFKNVRRRVVICAVPMSMWTHNTHREPDLSPCYCLSFWQRGPTNLLSPVHRQCKQVTDGF